MNEHIKELLLKVVHMQGEDGEYLPSLVTEEHIEKFAELLVQECATYLNVAVEVHNQNEQDVCDRAARAIKRYFGVE